MPHAAINMELETLACEGGSAEWTVDSSETGPTVIHSSGETVSISIHHFTGFKMSRIPVRVSRNSWKQTLLDLVLKSRCQITSHANTSTPAFPESFTIRIIRIYFLVLNVYKTVEYVVCELQHFQTTSWMYRDIIYCQQKAEKFICFKVLSLWKSGLLDTQFLILF